MVKYILLLIAASLMAACGSVATPEWAAEVQETQVALASTDEYLTLIAPTATPTDEPTATLIPATATFVPPTAEPTETIAPVTLTFTPSPIPTQAGQAVASASTADGDPIHGQELFNLLVPEVGFACATCHNAANQQRLIGPGLEGISQRAETRVEGQNAVEYLHTSIVHPNDYVVEDYPPGLMPQIYEEIFTEQEISDLVAYLLTL